MSEFPVKTAKKSPNKEQEPKLSAILEEEESNVSPEPDDSSGGGEHKVVHMSKVEQDPKLSPILEEDESNGSPEPDGGSTDGKDPKVVHASTFEQELKLSKPEETSEEEDGSKVFSKPVDSSGEHEPMEVLNPDGSSGEPMEVLRREVSIAKQSLIGDANPNLPITAKAPGYDMNSYSTNRAQAAANLVSARKNLELAKANFEVAQANDNILNQASLEDTSLPSRPRVGMGDMNTRTSIGSGERNADVAKEVGSSRSIGSTSGAKPPESDHVCIETCIHGGAKPKTRSLARTSVNTDVESSNPPDESEIILESLVTLMEGMVRKAPQNPARNVNREEWEEKLKNASYLTEEFGRPLGYRPIIQMPDDNSSSPYVVVHRQLNRMFLSLSSNDDGKLETQPCVVTRCGSDLAVKVSANLQEPSITATGHHQDKDSISESKDLEEVSDDNDVKSEDITAILLKWKISTNESEPVLSEKQDHIHQEEIVLQEAEHTDEQMEVPEEQVLEHVDAKMEDDEEKDQVERTEGAEEAAVDPQPEQGYRLIRLAPNLPPVNRIGPINPNHPYRERKLDRWRAAMMTAYRSERYHTTDLLDHTMSQLEAEGISRDDFYRLYHSTRLIDFYRDDGVHEAQTFSELRDMDLEDRINQIIIAVGYMTVAMLYMRLQVERNPEVPVVSEDSSESSTFDSGNIDSLESDPSVQYAPLREHVNIDLAGSPEGVQSTSARKQSSSSCSTTSTEIDTSYQSIINPPGNTDSPQGIQSPGNTDSPQGIQSPGNTDSSQDICSPDIIATQNIVGSSLSDLQSVLVPFREVAKQSQTSSSQQSLLNPSSDSSDSSSSSLQTPHSIEGGLKRETALKSSLDVSVHPTPSEGESKTDPKANKGDELHIENVGELINVCVDVTLGKSLQQSLEKMSVVDTTDEDSSPSQPPYTPSATPLQAQPQIPHNVGDYLRRRAILRSYRRSSQDAGKEGGLVTPVGKGSKSSTQIDGILANLLVNVILIDAKRSRSGHSVGDNGESSSTQVGARESENESTHKETRDPTGEVDIKSTGDQGECLIKEETEVTGDKEKTSEGKDKPEDDIHTEDADSNNGKHRKRKDHSDSDDEFQQLPKRSHIEN